MTFDDERSKRINEILAPLKIQESKYHENKNDPANFFDIIRDSRSPLEKVKDELLNIDKDNE